ncbi:MAG: AAA family ATPase [Polyangiaceae bacterium]|nr:AAA family ATPase [Polyangiaceae bacterium]
MVLSQARPARASALSDGECVAGRYTVIRELGRGGMAAVFLAFDSTTGDTVALKVLFFEQPQAAQKYAIWFHQEARALAALDHPAVVRARDFGSLPDGAPYLVMDAIEGRSLHSWKHLSPPPWPATWTIVDQVLSGLAHAHARSVIHGDLKPSNVMVDPRDLRAEPRAYVLDLGLAWLLHDPIDPRLGGEQEAPSMPLGGGTPGWLAPEQIRHATPHVGPPTDLYALGCILHEMVTGSEVFSGSSEEVLRQHRDAPVPRPSLKPDVPDGVAAFVVKMLAKRPWHRFRFAAEARAAWRAFKPDEPIRWRPSVPSSGARWQEERESRDSSPGAARHVAPGIVALRPVPFVGRERERAALRDAVDALARGEGDRHRMVILEGDAGVGKSRLAEWLSVHVHEQALMVPLRARYHPTPSPLDGLRGAILTHFNLVGQPREIIEQALLNEWEVARGDDDARTWVAATSAWLRPPAPDDPGDGGAGRRFVLDKPELGRAIVRHALTRIAQGRPVALWLDDVHLAPPATAEGLLYLHQDLATLPMLTVATVRTEAVTADARAAMRVEALSRIVPTVRLPLPPMDEAETRALLDAVLPMTGDAQSIAIERARGNPLFLLQLVHAWAGGGHFVHQGGRWSVKAQALAGRAVTTAELWEERVGAVPAPSRPAAYAAAALGTVFPEQVLSQLLTTLGLEASAAIAALVRAQLLMSEAGERLRFAHALLQEHLFSRVEEAPNAKEVFRAAADALSFHPDAGTDRVVRQRAQLLLHAGEPTAAADAIFHYVAAAWGRQRDPAATRVAISLLEGRVAGRHGVLLSRWKAEVERLVGNLPLARQLAEGALRDATVAGLSGDAAHASRLLAQIACDEGRPTQARGFVEDAYAMFLASGDDEGRAECELVLGQLESLLGNHDEAKARLANAAATFRQSGESLLYAQCTLVQARAEMARGRLAAAQELLRAARAEFQQIGYPEGLAQVELALAQVEQAALRHDAALGRAQATKARFETLGSARGMTDSARLAAMAALDLGDTAVARREASDALALATKGRRDPWGNVEAECLLAQIALAEGDLGAATDHLAAAEAISIDDAEPTQHRKLTAAWLALLSGDPDRALEAVTSARRAFSDQRRTGDHAPVLLATIEVLARGTPVEVPLAAWQAALMLRSRESLPDSTEPPTHRRDAT